MVLFIIVLYIKSIFCIEFYGLEKNAGNVVYRTHEVFVEKTTERALRGTAALAHNSIVVPK